MENVAPRTGGRGLKCYFGCGEYGGKSRPPHRGAWIEIVRDIPYADLKPVAPRTGGRGLKCQTNGRS